MPTPPVSGNGRSAEPLFGSGPSRRRHIAHTLKMREDEKRTAAEKVADRMTAIFGSIPFLVFNAIWFFLWITINTGLLPIMPPFDPFPFGLLTMIVSLEAIFLAIFVLMSQNRSERIAALRQEIDLHINTQTEAELTKLLELTVLLLKQNNIDVSGDEELQSMLEPTDVEILEEAFEAEVKE